MVHHLLGVPVIGQYAVFSFFVLSGFLMTAVMAGTYGYTPGGFMRFAANRALRLYPAYLVAIALVLTVIGLCGEDFTRGYREALFLPQGAGEWAANLSMVYPHLMPYDFTPRLLPATWALTVELTFYLGIGLGLSRTRARSALWLAASVIYTGAMLSAGADYHELYGLIPSGSLPFAVGACAWHWRDALRASFERRLPLRPETLLAAGLAWFLPFALIDRYAQIEAVKLAGLFLGIPIATVVIIGLFHAGAGRTLRRRDSLLGDYSYPVYLLHWPMGALASWMLYQQPILGANVPSLLSFALALLLTFAASTAVIRIVDPIIGRLRAAMKQHRPARGRECVSLSAGGEKAA
jgi:peptidoglycan/LPS O-acetylase OafA/YrhL